MNCKPLIATFALSVLCTAAMAQVSVPMKLLDAKGATKDAGAVTAEETEYGVVFTPQLTGLTPGLHGFHVHQNPDCGPAEKEGKTVPGGAAGGHFDPDNAKAHGTPWGKGHLGDLPPLFVTADGSATQPVLAPRLKLADLKGRSLMIHAGGDNHSDHPAALGGGGARMACGVTP
ncbi:superoxide dismutase [Cu-Zn] SodC [Hydrogenophaga sp. 5NK40-0174]|uniref:superoxide dismutase [Cu-Zn] SodC n=1 Tax=Hydrogenophaga sp. 5NK40-0174 TaxID=3127649 RepID=UPI00310883A1